MVSMYGAESILDDANRAMSMWIPGEKKVIGIIGNRFSPKELICKEIKRNTHVEYLKVEPETFAGCKTLRESINRLNSLIEGMCENNPDSIILYSSSIPSEIGIALPCDIELTSDELRRYMRAEYDVLIPEDSMPKGKERPISTPLFIKSRIDNLSKERTNNIYSFMNNWNTESAKDIASEEDVVRFMGEVTELISDADTKTWHSTMVLLIASRLPLSVEFVKLLGEIDEDVLEKLVVMGILVHEDGGYCMPSDVSMVISSFIYGDSKSTIQLIESMSNLEKLTGDDGYKWHHTYDRYVVASALNEINTHAKRLFRENKKKEEKEEKKNEAVRELLLRFWETKQEIAKKLKLFPPMEGYSQIPMDYSSDLVRLSKAASPGPDRIVAESEKYVGKDGSARFMEMLCEFEGMGHPRDIESLILQARTLQELLDWWGRLKKVYEPACDADNITKRMNNNLYELGYWQIILDDGSEASQYVKNILVVCDCRRSLTEGTEFTIDFLVPLVSKADVTTRANLEYYSGRLELLYGNYDSAREHFFNSMIYYGKCNMSIRENKSRCRYMQCCHKLGMEDRVRKCVSDLNRYRDLVLEAYPECRYIRYYIKKSFQEIDS